MINIATSRDKNNMKSEYENLEKYQELKEELKKLSKVKTKVVLVIIGIRNCDP